MGLGLGSRTTIQSRFQRTNRVLSVLFHLIQPVGTCSTISLLIHRKFDPQKERHPILKESSLPRTVGSTVYCIFRRRAAGPVDWVRRGQEMGLCTILGL